jgi:hypothetical protein
MTTILTLWPLASIITLALIGAGGNRTHHATRRNGEGDAGSGVNHDHGRAR